MVSIVPTVDGPKAWAAHSKCNQVLHLPMASVSVCLSKNYWAWEGRLFGTFAHFSAGVSVFMPPCSKYHSEISPVHLIRVSSHIRDCRINASYSLYWDIVMDWGMMQNPVKAAVCAGGIYPIAGTTEADDDEKVHTNCVHAFLRPRLRFGLGISLSILLTDVILRFSWTLRFYHKLFPSADSFVLCTEFLEIVRYVRCAIL